jgi:hypothetical protein
VDEDETGEAEKEDPAVAVNAGRMKKGSYGWDSYVSAGLRDFCQWSREFGGDSESFAALWASIVFDVQCRTASIVWLHVPFPAWVRYVSAAFRTVYHAYHLSPIV